MIDLEDVSFGFDETPVLEGVSLEVGDGEFVGLIGPNGAGKTTMIRLISGALTPNGGSVSVDDVDVAHLGSKAVSRRVAVVPQETRLSFDFPVRTVVSMGRNPYMSRFDRTRTDDRELVERALARTDAESLAERPFSELSGGEKKRVLIARAIAQDTSNLLLDEPTGGLDINHQLSVFELAMRLQTDGNALLAAIHDLNLAARYCDRLALLHDGHIAAIGKPKEVLQPSILQRAYGIETSVLPNPVTGTPMVIPRLASEAPIGSQTQHTNHGEATSSQWD